MDRFRIKGSSALPQDATQMWFSSDLHLGHGNIIQYCQRVNPHKRGLVGPPEDRLFQSPDEMDRELIDTWNSWVGEEDLVFHLGDFTMKGILAALDYLDKLNGRWVFLSGNHDYWMREMRSNKVVAHDATEKVLLIRDYLELKVFDEEMGEGHWQKLVMFHYPIASWNSKFKGSWHLYGHEHGTRDPWTTTAMDVGVDTNEYKPYSYLDIKTAFTRQHIEVKDSSLLPREW